MNEIIVVKKLVEENIRGIIEHYQRDFPELEIHSILIYAKGNYVTKKVDYHIYADVRGKGQIFLGMSS
jgi:hypothetical protein